MIINVCNNSVVDTRRSYFDGVIHFTNLIYEPKVVLRLKTNIPILLLFNVRMLKN